MRLTAALVLLAAWASTATPDSDNLDAALKKQAPEIIKYLREHKYQNVGVLKFVVKQGASTSDNAGPLNLSIANRLEVALVLANPDEQVGIIERASAAVVRARNGRANHLTSQGRAALFQIKEHYTLAWGDGKPVEADAFVTGTVEIGPDPRQLKVTVQAFDRKSKDLDTICTFTAATDFRTLAETGRSYHLAGARGPNESELLAQAIDQSQTIREEKQKSPLETGKSPIEVEVFYNRTSVRMTNGTVPEPKKGDRVRFVVTNRGAERYGVVLKVNGENTLFREPFDAPQCHKWILDPGRHVEIDGFQMGSQASKQFEVLSPEASRKDEVNYGEHAGTFSVTVFRELKADREIATASYEMSAIARGTLSSDGNRPGSLVALKAALKDRGSKAGTEGQKGIVHPGEDVRRPIQFVSFKTDPVPVLTATIRYWQGGK